MNCESPLLLLSVSVLIEVVPTKDAIVVFGIIFIVASLQWIFVGHKTFVGPRNLGGLLELARSEIGLDGRGGIVNSEAAVVPTLVISEKSQVAVGVQEGSKEE